MSVPTPRCCAAAERFDLVVVMTSRAVTRDSKISARWEWGPSISPRDGDFVDPPIPTHCPFCQTPLPRLRLKSAPPSPLCVPTDHYCLTCSERLQNCQCLPPECAWEIDE